METFFSHISASTGQGYKVYPSYPGRLHVFWLFHLYNLGAEIPITRHNRERVVFSTPECVAAGNCLTFANVIVPNEPL